ncbi:MAG: sulfur oxidation c-type cytochrome SoxA [Proteobacteria bacterium]|nr:sulfur oxidation c-type cytochrome SoxA [Pseudomonadota bacterium]
MAIGNRGWALWLSALLAIAGGSLAAIGWSQDSAQDPVAEYRAMMGDDNPAVFAEDRGKELWNTAQAGGKTLAATCDLGLGVGKTRGAYAALPRYFKDTGKVQDLEARVVTCLSRLGADTATLVGKRFGDGSESELESLTAYLVEQSRGVPMAVALSHPQERKAYDLGKAIFYYRAGTHDFSCATCHSQAGKRIRLQMLPDLATPEGARAAYTTWPAYRISQGEVRTMEWRLADCFRQQRLPELEYGSPAAVALTMFLAKSADGGVLAAPGLKR